MIRVVSVLWLALVWVLLWGDLSLGNVLVGLLFGTLIVMAFPSGSTSSARPRPVAIALYSAYFLWLLVVATASVARSVLRPRLRVAEGIVAVPLRATSPLVAVAVANSISLTPGTLTVEVLPRSFGVDREPQSESVQAAATLYVHVLDLGGAGADGIRSQVRDIEDKVVRAFGTATDLAAVLGEGVES